MGIVETTGLSLTEAECWARLADQSLGRLALSLGALPAIIPVQYYLEGRTITACLGDHPIPAGAVDDTVLAFAADSVDAGSWTGWCVQVLGTSRLSAGMSNPPDCGQTARGRLIRIVPAAVSGSALRLCPFLDGTELG